MKKSFSKISVLLLGFSLLTTAPTAVAQDWPDPKLLLLEMNTSTTDYASIGQISFELTISHSSSVGYSDITRIWICPEVNWDGRACQAGQLLVSGTPSKLQTNFVIESSTLTLADGNYLVTGVSFRNGAVVNGYTLYYPRAGAVTIGSIATNLVPVDLSTADFSIGATSISDPSTEPEPTPESEPSPEIDSEPEPTPEPEPSPEIDSEPDPSLDSETEPDVIPDPETESNPTESTELDESTDSTDGGQESNSNTEADATNESTEPPASEEVADVGNDAEDFSESDPVVESEPSDETSETPTTDQEVEGELTHEDDTVTSEDTDSQIITTQDEITQSVTPARPKRKLTKSNLQPQAVPTAEPVSSCIQQSPDSSAQSSEVRPVVESVTEIPPIVVSPTEPVNQTTPKEIEVKVETAIESQSKLPAALPLRKLQQRVTAGNGAMVLSAVGSGLTIKVKLGSRLLGEHQLTSRPKLLTWQLSRSANLKIIAIRGDLAQLVHESLSVSGKPKRIKFQMRS